jgi:DNA-directed RNA polymerase subunit RPC12/RpoP
MAERRTVKRLAPAGTQLRCAACGRLLKIDWPTKSIVCSCGAKVPVKKTERATQA